MLTKLQRARLLAAVTKQGTNRPPVRARSKKPMAVAIGIALQTARKFRGLTALQVARRVGVHRAILTRTEMGWYMPELATLAKHMAAVGLTVDDLAALIEATER